MTRIFTRTALLVLLFFTVSTPAIARDTATPTQALRDYVDRPDAAFAYDVIEQATLGTNKAYLIKLTSQTWQGIDWEHWLSLIVPADAQYRDQAILVISGGSNTSGPPKATSSEAMMLSMIAQQIGAPLAILSQVPNQPLIDGLKEDALIARTYAQYLDGGDDDLPLLLPMVKSAVRAMDAVQAVADENEQMDIERFIVTGASKRGWTTWLTAAVDDRVEAIAPMVIDMLNLQDQIEQQHESYGRTSEMIEEYRRENVIQRMDTERGETLLAMVDPYSYRDELTVPKLVVLGTNDPYWTVDAANLYFGDLPGENRLVYVTNAGHGLGPQALIPVAAFFRATLAGETLPALDWQRDEDGTLSVQWDASETGARATLWTATAPGPARDFRKATWTPTPLEGDGEVTVQRDAPESGFIAYFVEVSFPGEGPMPVGLSTEIVVSPDTFPFEADQTAE